MNRAQYIKAILFLLRSSRPENREEYIAFVQALIAVSANVSNSMSEDQDELAKPLVDQVTREMCQILECAFDIDLDLESLSDDEGP